MSEKKVAQTLTRLLTLAQQYYTEKSVKNLMIALFVLMIAAVGLYFLVGMYRDYTAANTKLEMAKDADRYEALKVRDDARNSLMMVGIPTGMVILVSLVMAGRGLYFWWQSGKKDVDKFPIARLALLANDNSKLGENLTAALSTTPEWAAYQQKIDQYNQYIATLGVSTAEMGTAAERAPLTGLSK